MTTDAHTFLDLIVDNWHVILIIAAVIGFSSRVTKKFNDLMHDMKDREAAQDRAARENYQTLKDEISHLSTVQQEFATELTIKYDDVIMRIREQDKKQEDRLRDQEKKRDAGVERTKIIMDGVEATLDCLKQNGNNGPVTEALNNIKAYKSRKSAKD